MSGNPKGSDGSQTLCTCIRRVVNLGRACTDLQRCERRQTRGISEEPHGGFAAARLAVCEGQFTQ